jgi:crotonobetainyl-CoA:carnitine CoA-transferase CaiB-like acyl-CoA transferase
VTSRIVFGDDSTRWRAVSHARLEWIRDSWLNSSTKSSRNGISLLITDCRSRRDIEHRPKRIVPRPVLLSPSTKWTQVERHPMCVSRSVFMRSCHSGRTDLARQSESLDVSSLVVQVANAARSHTSHRVDVFGVVVLLARTRTTDLCFSPSIQIDTVVSSVFTPTFTRRCARRSFIGRDDGRRASCGMSESVISRTPEGHDR